MRSLELELAETRGMAWPGTTQKNDITGDFQSGKAGIRVKKPSSAGCSAGHPFCRTANRIHGNNAVHLSLLEKTGLATGHMEKQPYLVALQ